MNNFELHELATKLSDTMTPYQLAKIVIALAEEVDYCGKPFNIEEVIEDFI
jgi:hypothetical protein